MIEQRPNFYRLLGLDPYATWDQTSFQHILIEKQKQWTRERTGIEPGALSAQQYLQLIPEIKRVMNNDELRANEAQRAKAEQGEQYQKRSIEFEHALQAIEQKGYLEEKEVAELIIEFQDVLSEDEVNQRINVPVYPMEAPVEEKSESLEAVVLHDIDEKLALIGLTNLYQLLGLPFTASSQELCRAAERLFDEMQRRQPKTAEVVAQVGLAGHARAIFSSEKKRQQFDVYRREQAVNALLQDLDKRMRGQRELSDQQAIGFLDAVSDAGYTSEQASDILRQHMQAKGWSFQQVAKESKERQYTPLVETIGSLVVQNIGLALRLTWIWPPDCYEAVVSANSEGWPGAGSEDRRTFTVTRAEYEGRGHYDLHMPPARHYFIIVEAITRKNGQQVVIGSVRGQGDLVPQIAIRYEIKNPRFGFRHRTLHLYTEKPVQIFATLLLVYKSNGQPLHKSDGELLHREAEPINMQATEHVIRLPQRAFPPHTYAKLFLEDDRFYSVILLHHPHERKLRLG
jgi:hypothetical protein